MQATKLRTRRSVIALMLLCVMPVAGAGQQASINDYKLTRLEQPLPAADFELLDMDGNRHSLRDYRGKVVLINFWGTWCPPCIREMPSMEQLYQKLKDEAFVLLAINQYEDEERVFEFMGQLKTIPTFPILFDPDSKVSAAYQVQGLPSSFVIDGQGRIVYRARGGRDFAHPQIEARIRALLPNTSP